MFTIDDETTYTEGLKYGKELFSKFLKDNSMVFFSVYVNKRENNERISGTGYYFLPESIYNILLGLGVNGIKDGYLGRLHYFNTNDEERRAIFNSRVIDDVEVTNNGLTVKDKQGVVLSIAPYEYYKEVDYYKDEIDYILGDVQFYTESGDYILGEDELDYLTILKGNIGVDVFKLPYEYFKDISNTN